MTAREADESLQRRLRAEGKIAGQEKVDDEADNVACSIAYIFVCPQQKQTIYPIVNGWWQASIHGKAYKLPELVALQHLVYFAIHRFHNMLQKYV